MHTCVCPSNDPSPHPTPPSSSVILTNSHLGGTRKYSTDLIFAISVIALVVDFNYNLCLRMVTVGRELNLIKVGIAFDSGGIAPIGAMSLRCVADHNTRPYPKNPRKVLSSCFCGSLTWSDLARTTLYVKGLQVTRKMARRYCSHTYSPLVLTFDFRSRSKAWTLRKISGIRRL